MLAGMNYQMAKQLYDAGFPQGGNGSWLLPPSQLVSRRSDRVYEPTLSELIVACGPAFASIVRHADGTFRASGTGGAARWHDVVSASPEEAVARLWLALTNEG
jgi:hypothetical protein